MMTYRLRPSFRLPLVNWTPPVSFHDSTEHALCAVKSGFAMTEVLNASQLTLLRRVAAAGYVRIVTAEEKTTLDELVARKLILGNQLTEAGWRELRKKPEDR